MVPLVRLELTLLSESDFESDASTNSTTGARGKNASRRGLYDETGPRQQAFTNTSLTGTLVSCALMQQPLHSRT